MAPEDFHAYSIDELFIDATTSLHLFAETPAFKKKRKWAYLEISISVKEPMH
ncbi:hypothetical protein F3K44_18185 [Bacillus megaterium]|nr:hypothetical protein [Priestia megaterium]